MCSHDCATRHVIALDSVDGVRDEMVFTQPARKARQLAVNMMTRTEWTKCRDYQFDPKNGRTDGRTWDNTHVDSKEWKKSMGMACDVPSTNGATKGKGRGRGKPSCEQTSSAVRTTEVPPTHETEHFLLKLHPLSLASLGVENNDHLLWTWASQN